MYIFAMSFNVQPKDMTRKTINTTEMRKWIKYAAVAAVCLTGTGCSKESGTTAEREAAADFQALVMGGKTIDPQQNWNTASNVNINISADLGNSDYHTVYILQTPPLYDTKAVCIGMARLRPGESKTISVAKPANTGLLYAACFDSNGHAVCQPFPVTGNSAEVKFSGISPGQISRLSASTGNAWSVPSYELPDLTAYTTGSLREVADVLSGQTEEQETHMALTTSHTGTIPNLTIYERQSLYVTGTWTLNMDQQVAGGNVIVVGAGGEIVIPEGYKLTASPFGGQGKPGLIYILPGGRITGKGTLELAHDGPATCYNAGTLDAASILLSGGTVYNTGTIGNAGLTETAVTCADDGAGHQGALVNHGFALLTQMDGALLSIQNAGFLQVDGELTLNSSSRMDDGSYTQCGSLTLNGSASEDKILYMGNAAFMNCEGSFSTDNFGVWGPSGTAFESNAIFKIGNCSHCATTDGRPGTYLLDHVELITPAGFPTVFDDGALNVWDSAVKGIGIGKLQPGFPGYHNLRMLYYWMNGYEGKLLNTDNYHWAQTDGGAYNFCWNSAARPYATGTDPLRQTCIYSTSPSYSYSGFTTFSKGSSAVPNNSCIYYAFETPEGQLKDYDYNDVVLRVNTPIDQGDGTFTSLVQIMCVGNTVKTTVLYNGEPFGNGEIHAAIGTTVEKPINVTNIIRVFRRFGELTFNSTDFRIDRLPFTLQIEDNEGNLSILKPSASGNDAPLFFVVNGNTRGRWFWPVEGANIGVAYPLFSTWGSHPQMAADWYDSSNAANSRTVVWE